LLLAATVEALRIWRSGFPIATERLHDDSVLHICSKLLLGTERMSLGAFDFHPALPFRMQLLRISKTSKVFVLPSRLAGKHVRRVIVEFTKSGLTICCAQLGFLI